MNNLPVGTVTFLFTDIEGSTQLWEKHPEEMTSALANHDAILRKSIGTNNGHIIKTTGDGVHAVFITAIDAITASIAAQNDLKTTLGNLPIKVRMGLRTGEAELRARDYYVQALNRAARLMAIAHGGQILVSNATTEIIYGQLPADTSLLDLGEHRLKDLVRPEHIFQLTNTSLENNFPPLKSLDAFPNNLPIQLTSFIGRERELTESKRQLASARLLTLIGSGGTGKTRLALQLAADLLPAFADGVWWVELAALSDPDLILQSVALVFGLREQMGMSLHDIVTNYLRAKQTLLILDNCEHLIEACARLTDQILHVNPTMKIIVSSREALGINGDTIYLVPSLSLPGQTQVTPEALTEYESAQLFLERALAVNPKFNLTEKNATFIAQICRRLDGIPLALELAAARIIVFSPEQIASRLGDRFNLLTGGSRTALPRQQTLEAMIDWSYDILSEPERALLRGFSVFAGGWTFEAAEAIYPDLDALNLLTQLINKSLVVVDEESEETRYYLLETIRQYARDKLLEAGESEQIRNHHLDFFLKFAEDAEPKIDTPEAVLWMRRLESDYDNFRTALEWALENNIEAALRLVSALQPSWVRRGHMVEGYRWVNDALAKAETLSILEYEASDLQKKIQANAWIALANLLLNLGDNDQVILACEKCLTFALPLGDKRLTALALTYELYGKLYSGDTEWASTKADEILAAARESGDRYLIGLALAASGDAMATIKRDFAGSHVNLKEGITLLKESGNLWGLSMGVMSLGITAKFLGDYDEARLQFAACIPAFREIGDQHRVTMCQSELAHLERYEGHFEQAASIYRQTIPVWQKLGHRAAVAHQLECLAIIAKVSEQDPRAAQLFGAAEALRAEIHIAMTAEERVEYDREITDLRTGMEEKAFNSNWAEGRTLTMDQAIQFALSEQEQ